VTLANFRAAEPLVRLGAGGSRHRGRLVGAVIGHHVHSHQRRRVILPRQAVEQRGQQALFVVRRDQHLKTLRGLAPCRCAARRAGRG
jgi:hypothetical protein